VKIVMSLDTVLVPVAMGFREQVNFLLQVYKSSRYYHSDVNSALRSGLKNSL
jgi:hypothetical protein